MSRARSLIESVNWQNFGWWYGEGAEILALLRRVSAGDQREAEQALRDLAMQVTGPVPDIFDGAAAVIPVLVDLALDERIQVRDGIFRLLDEIAECVNDRVRVDGKLHAEWLAAWNALYKNSLSFGYMLRRPDRGVNVSILPLIGRVGDQFWLHTALSVDPAVQDEFRRIVRDSVRQSSWEALVQSDVLNEDVDSHTLRLIDQIEWEELECVNGDPKDLPGRLGRVFEGGDDAESALTDILWHATGSGSDLSSCVPAVVDVLWALTIDVPRLRGPILRALRKIVVSVSAWRELGLELQDYWLPAWESLRSHAFVCGYLLLDSSPAIRDMVLKTIGQLYEWDEIDCLAYAARSFSSDAVRCRDTVKHVLERTPVDTEASLRVWDATASTKNI